MNQPADLPQGPSGARPASPADGRVARPITPQEVLALMRGVHDEAELAERLKTWRQAATDPTIPRFDLRGSIGKGAQGTVWSVADRDFLRPVAIKTMHERDRLPEDVSRFVHEAQITAQLEHPGVVPVHDLQVLPDGTVFYVMKRIEGQTLAELMPDPSLDAPVGLDRQRLELLDIILKILDTMAFAHSRGVIHRDLKPKNIMVGRFGEVLVLDWGLAKIVDSGDDTPRHGPAVFSLRSMGEDGGSANATGAGCAVGTPAFMSPEQASGEPADQRSDVYGLGVILYHALTGMSPYDVSGGARHVLEQAACGTWVTLEERASARGIPRRLIAIVHKAMALRPIDRYASAEAFAQDLRQFLAGEAVAAYRESVLDRCLRVVGRHRRVVITGLVAAGLAGAGWAWIEARYTMQRQSQISEARRMAAQAELVQSWDEARRAYERLLDLEPGDRLSQQAMLRVRKALDRRAEEDLQQRKRDEAQVLRHQARRWVTEATDASLGSAQKAYLGALGLTPEDGPLTKEYGQLVSLLAEREAQRRQDQILADRSTQAANLRRRATEAEAAGRLQEAIGYLEGSINLIPRAEDTRRIFELAGRLESQERARREAARRIEADGLLKNLDGLLAMSRGRDAREILERARGIDPAHPEIPRLEVLVQGAERRERERSAESSLAHARDFLEVAAVAKARAEREDLTCRKLNDQLVESPSDDARRALHRSEADLAAARLSRARSLADALGELHQARTEAPWHPRVNGALADFYVARLMEAEAEGIFDEAAAAEAQARTYDDGSRAALLDGRAQAKVPEGAAPVTLTRIERDDLRRLNTQGPSLQIAPGSVVDLRAGRWLAVNASGTRQSLRLGRGEVREIKLPEATLPPGTALVPGDDQLPTIGLMIHEVTCQEYLQFLNDPTVRQEIEAARSAGRLIRVPRASHTSTEPLWRTRGSALRSGSGLLVETADGRALDLASPITGISPEDAVAYARWRARRDGIRWRLPTLREWRHAVQGGDGRVYPWGDAADLGLCASFPACAALPKDALPPVGSFPTDASVQGVEDLAGSVSEFVDGADDTLVSAGGLRLVPMMGGSRFDVRPERFVATHRRDVDPRFVHPGAGFRLAFDP